MKRINLLGLIALSLLIGGNALAGDAYRESIEKWHEGRMERLLKDTGYLSLVGLFALGDGPHTFGSDPDNDLVFPEKAPANAGTITVHGDDVHLDVNEGVRITSDDEQVSELTLYPDVSDLANQLEMGSFVFYIIERAGELYLRVKDRQNPAITEFSGIERFPVDEKWRIQGTFIPYDPPIPITVPDILGHNERVPCPGKIVFAIDGHDYELEPLARYGDEFFVVFGDATSGVDTYGGGRFVYTEARDNEGPITIDFNKAYSPPCAFNPFATCPLPHENNMLPIRIEAGEKDHDNEQAH